jgi:hypothetical protein
MDGFLLLSFAMAQLCYGSLVAAHNAAASDQAIKGLKPVQAKVREALEFRTIHPSAIVGSSIPECTKSCMLLAAALEIISLFGACSALIDPHTPPAAPILPHLLEMWPVR